MVLTPSSMMPLGTKAPDFKLIDVTFNEEVSLKEIQSDIGTVIMFICNHCPYVKHIQEMMVALARDYIMKGITFAAINSNDIHEYPEDSPEEMKKLALELDFPFPYLFDETQRVARSYGAACTPDFFVFDGDLECVYRGQFDDSRPGNHLPVTGKDLAEALDCLIMGKEMTLDQHPSIGCNIKWMKPIAK
ncbi:MAG: thioredoxin family protein [Chlamydiia bacterium]|nr:thioredoxin family protein [Chlamydiia bacterium]